MANFKVKDKKIIPEFVGSLMKAIARGGTKKTIKKLEKDPVIRKSVANIKKIDKDLQNYISKQSKDPEWKKGYDDALDFLDNL